VENHDNQALCWLASSHLVEGLELAAEDKVYHCDACAAGKVHRALFPPSNTHAEGILDLVHLDLLAINFPLLEGAYYVLTFMDDHSRKLWIYFLKHKSNVFQFFNKWLALVEHQTGRKLCNWRTDHGGEFTAAVLEDFLRSQGILHQFSVPYTA
jgi:hypothetical protein